MDLNTTVCVATFGGREWIKLAQRALASAEPQAAAVHVHAETLAAARNEALAAVDTEFVIFLDADDELEPGYVDALATGNADIRVPAVRYVRGQRSHRAPYVPVVPGHTHQCEASCLPAGNYIVIGALARTSVVRAAGGWLDEELYEDWSLWLRCHRHGATFETITAAVYRARVRRDSRNRAPSRAEMERWHHQIAQAHAGAPA